jgi:hypothetical protein
MYTENIESDDHRKEPLEAVPGKPHTLELLAWHTAQSRHPLVHGMETT